MTTFRNEPMASPPTVLATTTSVNTTDRASRVLGSPCRLAICTHRQAGAERPVARELGRRSARQDVGRRRGAGSGGCRRRGVVVVESADAVVDVVVGTVVVVEVGTVVVVVVVLGTVTGA